MSIKDKIEIIVSGCYIAAIVMTAITKQPVCMLITGLSFPISKKVIDRED